MLKAAAQLTFNLLIIVGLSVALYFSQDWPKETALFPQAVGLPILILSIVSFGMALWRTRRGIPEPGEGSFLDADVVRKAGIILAWLLGFAVAIWIVGFYLASFFFVFFYMKLQGKMNWITCFSYPTVYMILVFVLFDMVLHVNMYRGIVWGLLGF